METRRRGGSFHIIDSSIDNAATVEEFSGAESATRHHNFDTNIDSADTEATDNNSTDGNIILFNIKI